MKWQTWWGLFTLSKDHHCWMIRSSLLCGSLRTKLLRTGLRMLHAGSSCPRRGLALKFHHAKVSSQQQLSVQSWLTQPELMLPCTNSRKEWRSPTRATLLCTQGMLVSSSFLFLIATLLGQEDNQNENRNDFMEVSQWCAGQLRKSRVV